MTKRRRKTLITFAMIQIMKTKKKREILKNKAVSRLTLPRDSFNTTEIPLKYQHCQLKGSDIAYLIPGCILLGLSVEHRMCSTFE